MNIGQQMLFLVSGLGVVNGSLLSLYLFFRKKTHSLPVMFLSLMLMAISLRIGNSVFYYFNAELPALVMQIGWSACFLIGPSLYYFFSTILNKPGKGLSVNDRNIWIITTGIILIGGILQPYATDPDIWCKAISYFIYAQWGAFLIAAGILLKPVFNQVLHHEPLNITQKFWLLLYGGNAMVFLAYILSMTGIFAGLCLAAAVAFSFMLFVTVFYYFYRTSAEDILRPAPEMNGLKTNKKRISFSEAENWIERLQTTLAENELYKNPNLKLGDLAQKINIPLHQLSQLLNEHLGKNFSTYINEYRINEACKLIANDSRLSFEAIGYEVGFNSKSTFYSAFRKIKKTTPALFREKVSDERG